MSMPLMLNKEPSQENSTFLEINSAIHFVICGSCFWCASDLSGARIKKCPACKSAVESLPLARTKYR